jgi:ribulose-5-phosphate 4-epimerase/fuculose-1-phosphate aldolase
MQVRHDLTPAQKLALLARILHREGYNDQDVGHMTLRQEDGTFLALPRELGWDETTASDIIRISAEGQKLDGIWSYTNSLALHLEFHRARPGVNVTVHQHPEYATVYSALGRVPDPYDQRAAMMRTSEITMYSEYTGTVDNLDAAQAAVRGIGEAPCALLRNHGVFVTAASIEEAHSRAVILEWRCRLAWRVESVGDGLPMPESAQAQIADFKDAYVGEPLGWQWAVRRELRADPAVLD